MSNEDLDPNMRPKKVYNDMIDEEINLENPEEITNQPKEIKNQPVDEVHNVSDDSGDVPSPREDEEDFAGGKSSSKTGMGNVGQPSTNQAERWIGYSPDDYTSLNLSPEISQLFKHITK